MQKLKLLTTMLMTIAFLLSLWAVPVVLILLALTSVHTLWIQIVIYALSVVWLLMVRPWTIFADNNFSRLASDIRRTIKMLFD